MCDETEAALIQADCTARTWDVSFSDCGTLSCGGNTCAAGQVCKELMGGAHLFECVTNPCDGAVEADCACSVCGPAQCTVEGFTVRCNTCPSGLCP
jgi:hypothetical protein